MKYPASWKGKGPCTNDTRPFTSVVNDVLMAPSIYDNKESNSGKVISDYALQEWGMFLAGRNENNSRWKNENAGRRQWEFPS